MNIMFVCTGNICRSAMAHKLLEKKLKDEKLKNVNVYSCGIFAEDGDRPTINAEEAMEEYGVDIKSHRATNIQNSKIEAMDLILCATKSHKNSVLQIKPDLADKVFTMKEYVKYDANNIDVDIKDPWGYDLETYRACLAQIDRCLDLLINKIKEDNIEK